MLGQMSNHPLTLVHAFNRAERLFAEKTITTLTATGRERQTYGEWARRTRRLGGALDALGVAPGARVGTFAWNSARHLELYFAVPCSGRVLHTLNIRLFPEQVTYIVNHAEDEVVFVDRSLAATLLPLIADAPSVRHVVVMDDGAGEVPADDRIVDYEALIGASPAVDFHIDDENQAAAMCYTSGTTGHPKGVVYSHRSTVLHSLGVMLADTLGVSERDTILPIVPMFHANAWGLPYAAAMAGSTLAFPGPQMSPAAIAELIESEHVTVAAGVPTIWAVALDELHGRDLSALRAVVCGGSAVPQALSEAYEQRIGMPILQAWGMTETSPVGSVCTIKSTLADLSADELARLRASQGIPMPLVEARIVEPGTTHEVEWNGRDHGELEVVGPWVAASYYGAEDGREASFTRDGWLRTGDVATISPDGYIRLVDRTKDLVKSGGEWISSVELENAIMAHPAVLEAAVIAVPDERWGERPLACVVRADHALTADDLRAFLSSRVAGWWIPERVEFIDEVPKTSVGKFSKKTLREQFGPG